MGTLLEEKSASETETGNYAPPLQEGEGWQILKDDLYREVKVNALRFGAGFLILGGIICGGFWGLKQFSAALPQMYKEVESRLVKILPKTPAALPVSEPVKAVSTSTAGSAERSRARVRTKHISHRQRGRGPVAVRPRQSYWGVENPTGGEVKYTDGTITEYTWH